MRIRIVVLALLAVGTVHPEEEKSRARQLTEINAKIADLQRQIDYWQEKKRRLLDIPDVPRDPQHKAGEPQIHTGPRNGKYHYSPSGQKIYQRK